MNERDDFIVRCLKLDSKIGKILEQEDSDHVRCSVLINLIAHFVNKQPNIEKAAEQAIESIRSTYKQLICEEDENDPSTT